MYPDDSREIILQQVEHLYERSLDLKKTLENKANNAIIISGIIATLLFGFTSFLVDSQLQIIPFLYLLITVAIIFAIFSLRYSMASLKIILSSHPFANNITGEYNLKNNIEEYKKDDKNKVMDKIIDSYISEIKINEFNNTKKSELILKSQNWLRNSMYIISIVVIILTFQFFIHFYK